MRTGSVDETLRAVSEALQSYQVQHEPISNQAALSASTDALIFAAPKEWITVLWPSYFNVHDFPLALAFGKSRPWLISTIHVYDDEYWEHLAVQGSELLHSYCSRPGFWEGAPEEQARLAKFRPDPAKFAAATGVDADAVQAYLVDVDGIDDPAAKAHADDQFALADFWVFTDFWRKVGIEYPNPQNPGAVLRLSKWFGKRLPTG